MHDRFGDCDIGFRIDKQLELEEGTNEGKSSKRMIVLNSPRAIRQSTPSAQLCSVNHVQRFAELVSQFFLELISSSPSLSGATSAAPSKSLSAPPSTMPSASPSVVPSELVAE
jgi:hypothetical protein